MRFENEKRKLRELYSELGTLKIPQSTENEVLSSIIEKLLEMDSYYAGLALSAAGGTSIEKKQLYDINELKTKLRSISPLSSKDWEIYEVCKVFIDKLYEIDTILRYISK